MSNSYVDLPDCGFPKEISKEILYKILENELNESKSAGRNYSKYVSLFKKNANVVPIIDCDDKLLPISEKYYISICMYMSHLVDGITNKIGADIGFNNKRSIPYYDLVFERYVFEHKPVPIVGPFRPSPNISVPMSQMLYRISSNSIIFEKEQTLWDVMEPPRVYDLGEDKGLITLMRKIKILKDQYSDLCDINIAGIITRYYTSFWPNYTQLFMKKKICCVCESEYESEADDGFYPNCPDDNCLIKNNYPYCENLECWLIVLHRYDLMKKISAAKNEMLMMKFSQTRFLDSDSKSLINFYTVRFGLIGPLVFVHHSDLKIWCKNYLPTLIANESGSESWIDDLSHNCV